MPQQVYSFENNNLLIRLQGTTRQGIRIGKNCWIGAKVTILDGVSIGDHCVIAAGAVVTKNIPPHSVIGGVPARIIKSTVNGQRPTADGLRPSTVSRQSSTTGRPSSIFHQKQLT